jgi:hypothetical protein
VLLLARIKENMERNLLRQPDYTCRETIERSLRRPPSRRYQLLDTLRLEVALVGGKELVSWPGAGEFQDRDIRELVPYGTIGTGSYALHARSVFLSAAPTYRHAGVEEIDGRRAVRFDYSVSLSLSGYKLRVERLEAVVAHAGSFWADERSLDLIRLDVNALAIPAELGLAAAHTSMRYERMRIGGGEFLLPAAAVTTLVHSDGSESRNETRFSACRQYVGESVLSFAEPPAPEAEARAARIEPVRLPDGMQMLVTLASPIELERTAVGDLFEGVLERDLKWKGELLFRRGARVTGRILHCGRTGIRGRGIAVGVRLESLEGGRRRAAVNARLEGFRSVLPRGQRPEAEAELRAGGVQLPEIPEAAAMPGVSLFYVNDGRLRMPRGILMVWRTVEPD